ncbi:MAG: pyridoxal phosphate-dependent aminotransferase [Geminicoccaceae bacterium]|nr:pyridoxal phosphate-dependent aminotransferase [Geminicoccaceae bacterium]MCS7267183.1 pyridoxal phosphate-dependent aminotransferase [Geminicoccaceae bacterium]MDW8124036.1 pyridoxal phosphate-dependent aminotransferase [Geminicoccaceae bacterium]MDW8341274.1 pyridoxal phosphate-dependent aminotransferase [Geminicoccaceae bacterium]
MRLAAAMARLGTETAFDVLARATRLKESGRDVINLGIGQPDFPTPPNIVEAAVKALRDGHHGYTPANGIRPLREAVAEDMWKRRGVTVDPDRIVIVPGGKVTMFMAIAMFGEPGAEILYPDPGFPIYRSLIEWSGATPIPIALHESKGYAFSAEEVLAQITPRTRLLIVNSPANPTGGVVPKAELDRLVEGLMRHPHVAVLSDEIYARIVYDGVPHASLTAYPELDDRLVLLDGWSKTYAMTGWRLGWGVWPKALVEHAVRLAVNVHSCVNAAAQWAGIEALRGPQDAVEAMVRAFDERRRVIVEELNAIPGFRCPMPGGAFYAFPNITGTGLSSRELQDRLLEEAGVAVVSGTSFGIFGEGYLRFSYAASTEAIREACARIRRWLERTTS